MSPAVYWYALNRSTEVVNITTSTVVPFVYTDAYVDGVFLFGMALGLVLGIVITVALKQNKRKRK